MRRVLAFHKIASAFAPAITAGVLLWPHGAQSVQDSGLLIPVYDAFEDVGALMTPSYTVEMNSTHERVEAAITFSRMHKGERPAPGAPHRILMTLLSPRPFFSAGEAPRLVVLAAGHRMVYEDFELVGREGCGAPILTLRLWMTAADVARMGSASKVECRAGRYDFALPDDLRQALGQLTSTP